MARVVAIGVGTLALIAGLVVAGAWVYLSNIGGQSPIGGLRGPLFYDGCDPGGRLTRPMLSDPATRLQVAAARRSGESASAPHDMLFEHACASGNIVVTYAGDLDAAYVELQAAIPAAGWTENSRPAPRLDGRRSTSYWKRVDGVYYDLGLVESPATSMVPASTAIVISIPDAHWIDRYRPEGA